MKPTHSPPGLLRKPEVILKVPVNARITQPLPGMGQRHLALHLRHAQRREGPAGEDGHQVLHRHLLVYADDAQRLVAGLGPDGHLLDDALDVFKPGVAQQRAQALGQHDVHAELGEGLPRQLVHVLDRVVVGHGAVVAEGLGAELLELDPSAVAEGT